MLKSYFNQAVSFVQEAWTELQKVHFTTPKETLQAAAVVVILSLMLALFLGLIDFAATGVVRRLVS